jgi:hypothetical protein
MKQMAAIFRTIAIRRRPRAGELAPPASFRSVADGLTLTCALNSVRPRLLIALLLAVSGSDARVAGQNANESVRWWLFFEFRRIPDAPRRSNGVPPACRARFNSISRFFQQCASM